MNLITIASYDNIMTAQVVETRLKSEGIECRIYRNITLDLAWATPSTKNGYEIQVLEEDRQRAVLIINEFE